MTLLTRLFPDALLAELKAVPIIIHEVTLYRDWASVSSSSCSHSSHLWDLLTSSRNFLNYVLNIPRAARINLPSTFFNLLPYALIVLSTVARLPSTIGWDSVIAKREADATTFGLQIKAKFGDELTKTSPEASIEQRDVWQYFSRGIGGLIAWHQRYEAPSSTREAGLEVPLSSSSGGVKCGVADTLSAFSSMGVRKHSPLNFGNVVQEQMTTNAAGGYDEARGETQPDILMPLWDDEAWQSIVDDFSMFPTPAGFLFGQ
ncbi:hypothetical protein G647_07223 [Cladophialophora carrionii CBS 160.54]|uniref:Uncharacterized protein n=1 Tax=Cladophialophora carrionii CBS 160.54 TaxID=1279043 RepID=V9D1Z6_9EURO|nr:uncharacterized protein G647_07223 [Cladophialophora carrionii CBS 160.54]ETI20880.1 hypothetical protein G647_07223 [Cladophialophora carrionii CBS 160.54]